MRIHGEGLVEDVLCGFGMKKGEPQANGGMARQFVLNGVRHLQAAARSGVANFRAYPDLSRVQVFRAAANQR